MEQKADALFTAIQSSVDDNPFDLSSTVRHVRLAVDTAACQVSSDLKHLPRASSRSPSRRSIPAMNRSHSISNMLQPTGGSGRPITPPQQLSPRASFCNKPAEQQQPSTGASFLTNPVLASPATHCFADYFQARKSGTAADAFYSRQLTSKSFDARSCYSSQPSRKSPNAPSYYNAEPCSPSGLKSVLARLEQVRPATVVLQHMKSAADASCQQRLQLGSGCSTAEGQQHCGAPGRSSLPVNIKPTAAQAYVPGTLKGSTGSDLPGLLAPMSDKRPWSGAESPVQQRPVSPQNMLVLRTLALHTPHNIVPRVLQDRASSPVAGQTTQCCAPRSPPHGQSSSCCHQEISVSKTCVCGTGALSVRLPGSPLHHLICHGCNQMHTMQQHQSCCHRCCSCCNCSAAAAGSQQRAPTAEPSSASSNACSCPCIRAYKKGHRDAQKVAAVQPGIPRGSDLAAGLQDTMTALQLTDTAVANAIAHATGNAAAAAAATAAAATGMEGSGFGEENDTDSLMEVLRQLAAVQEELLNQGHPFDASQLGEVADQLAECVANSQPQHEQLLRQVLEQQQQLLAVQQRALLDSTSGAGGQAPQQQQLQFQQQHQQPGWGELDELELPEDADAAAQATADSEARARTGSWVVQHQVQQTQQQGGGDSYPAVNKQYPGGTAGMGFEQVVRPGSEQGFDRPLAARLPAGASISSPKVRIAQANSNAFSAVDKILSAGMSKEDQLAAAAAADTAMPEAVNPAVQHVSYSRADSNQQAGKQSLYTGRGTQWHQGPALTLTLEELAEAMAIGQSFPAKQQHQQPYSNDRGSNNSNNRENKAGAACSKLPGMEEIDSVIAAYNAAGVFTGQHSQQGQHGEPLVHFMMTPQQTSGAGGESSSGGSVLRQGPPQVTAVAQLVRIPSEFSRLLSGAGELTRPSGTVAGEGAGMSPSSRSIADSAWSVLANGASSAAAASAAHQSPRALNSPIGRASPLAPAQQVVNSPGAVAQQQQSRSAADASHSVARFSTPLASDPGQGSLKQQYLSSSAAAAAMEAVTASQNHGSAAKLHSHAGHGGDYLESQLSRLNGVRQGGSSPGSIAGTPCGSRLATAPGGPLSASGAQSQRPSVRFIDEQSPHAAAESPNPEQPGTAAKVSKQAVVHAQLQPQQPAELFMLLRGQDQQQQQQQRSMVAARAGSFQAPDSEVSSAAASARPSASQVSLQQKQQQQHRAAGCPELAAAATAVAAQQASAATWSRSVSTASARQSRSSAGDCMPVTISNLNTAASASASPGSPGPKSSSTLSAVAFSNAGTASRASRSSDISGLIKMQSQKQPHQPADLEQLASPVASVPVSTSSSFMQHLPPASAMRQQPTGHAQQQQQPTPQSNDSIAKQAQGEGSSRSVAATPAGSAPVSSSGAAASWKQQQLLMMQQLAAQQQQLKQIQSVGNSVVTSPRSSRGPFSRSTTVGRSSVINATAAGTAAVVRAPSVSGSPGGSSMIMVATSLSENVMSPAKSLSGWASEQPAANKQLPVQGTPAELSRVRVGNAPSSRSFKGKLSFESQHEDGLPASPAAATSAAALMASSDEECDEEVGSQIGQATLRNVLLQRLLLRRKGRLMHKALSTWWRYTVAVRTLTQESAPSSTSSSSIEHDATGQPAVSLSFPGLQGLQKELAAAVRGQDNMPDNIDIVISGQVRLQCSPVRQRPQSAGVLGVAADAAAGSAAEVLTCRSDTKRWGSPDIAAARATAALAVAASRSPGRCRSIGKAAAVAAEQAAADAFAAQAKPLQAALREVHSMIAAMEDMCETGESVMSSNAGSNRPLTHKIAPGVAAAVVKACRGTSGDDEQNWQHQQRSLTSQSSAAGRTRLQQQQEQHRQHQAALRSPDKYKLRGQLHHVQDRLSKLEKKMIQAASMQEDPCFCNSAADGMSGARSRTSCSPKHRRMQMDSLQHDEQCEGCATKCKGGCVRRMAAKRQALVGRMQDEIGQLQQELAELRLMMPGAYV